MDVVALIQHGVNGVVATLGTALTNEQARLLKRYAPEIWVSYDGDSAGQHAIVRALDIFEQEDIKARVLFFPDNLDPDEFIRQRGLDAFQQLRPLRAAEYLLQRAKEDLDLSDDEGRMEYARRSAQILRKVKEPIELDHYLKNLTVDTGISREVLIQQMGITMPETQQTQRPAFRVTRKNQQESAHSMEEKTLISILASGLAPENAIRAEDFDTPLIRQLAEKLLSGTSPASILSQCENDQDRQEISDLFALDIQINEENAASMAEQCLNTVRVHRLQRQIDDISANLNNLDNENKQEELKQLMALTTELNRIKRLVH